MFTGAAPGIVHNQYPPHGDDWGFPEQSLEPLSIRYPESSQRTLLRDGQFPEGSSPPNSQFHDHAVLFPGSQFSTAPTPVDTPPPPRPRAVLFSGPQFSSAPTPVDTPPPPRPRAVLFPGPQFSSAPTPVDTPPPPRRPRAVLFPGPQFSSAPTPVDTPPPPRPRAVLFPGPQFSSAPTPADTPPPPPRPPIFNPSRRAIFPPLYSTTSNAESTIQTSNSYRELSLSLSDSEEEFGQTSYRHLPSDFIPIVPEPSSSTASYAGADSSFSFDGSDHSSSPRSPMSGSILSPPSFEASLSSPDPLGEEAGEARPRKVGPPKMHQCHVCSRQFPRPSGLRTHMNMHNNARPYSCGFENCTKTFSVRSNARRHYRTHVGATPAVGPPPPPPQVQFEEPIKLPPQASPPALSLSRAPFRLRWVPPNLSARSKAVHPAKPSDTEQGAEKDIDNEDDFNDDMADYDFGAIEPATTTPTYYQNSWHSSHVSCAPFLILGP